MTTRKELEKELEIEQRICSKYRENWFRMRMEVATLHARLSLIAGLIRAINGSVSQKNIERLSKALERLVNESKARCRTGTYGNSLFASQNGR